MIYLTWLQRYTIYKYRNGDEGDYIHKNTNSLTKFGATKKKWIRRYRPISNYDKAVSQDVKSLHLIIASGYFQTESSNNTTTVLINYVYYSRIWWLVCHFLVFSFITVVSRKTHHGHVHDTSSKYANNIKLKSSLIVVTVVLVCKRC